MSLPDHIAGVPNGTKSEPLSAGDEMTGPLRINRGLRLDGAGCTVWAKKGPVVIISAREPVTLQNLNIEVTSAAPPNTRAALALEAEAGAQVAAANVWVAGEVKGLSESAFWKAPHEMQLQLEPGQSYQFILRAAEACDVQWEISQVGSGSRRLAAGETQTVTLALPPVSQPRSLIRGQVAIRRADGALLRSIPVSGWVRKPRSTSGKGVVRKPLWLKLVLLLLSVCAVAAIAWHYVQIPALVVEPARIDFGTLWYSPPVGGHIQTAIVFTARWRVPPRSSENPVLVAREECHGISDTGQDHLLEETFTFPLSNGVNEARIPLGCDLTNETVQVSGTVSLTVSNARVRLLPSEIRFEATFKPASETKL